jgi:hypothetical protein
MPLYTALCEVNCGMDPDGNFDIFEQYVTINANDPRDFLVLLEEKCGYGYSVKELYSNHRIEIIPSDIKIKWDNKVINDKISKN